MLVHDQLAMAVACNPCLALSGNWQIAVELLHHTVNVERNASILWHIQHCMASAAIQLYLVGHLCEPGFHCRTTGNVNLTINNQSEILTLKNVEASYVFKNIQRGDYLITAYYMGDDRNTPSQDPIWLSGS